MPRGNRAVSFLEQETERLGGFLALHSSGDGMELGSHNSGTGKTAGRESRGLSGDEEKGESGVGELHGWIRSENRNYAREFAEIPRHGGGGRHRDRCFVDKKAPRVMSRSALH